MRQRFRRQLLSLSPTDADRGEVFTAFMEFVMDSDREEQPSTEGVRDVLLAIGLSLDETTELADRFDRTVWKRA